MTAPVAVGHPDLCSVCYRAVQRAYWFGRWVVCERHHDDLLERWYHKDVYGAGGLNDAAARALLIRLMRDEVHGE